MLKVLSDAYTAADADNVTFSTVLWALRSILYVTRYSLSDCSWLECMDVLLIGCCRTCLDIHRSLFIMVLPTVLLLCHAASHKDSVLFILYVADVIKLVKIWAHTACELMQMNFRDMAIRHRHSHLSSCLVEWNASRWFRLGWAPPEYIWLSTARCR